MGYLWAHPDRRLAGAAAYVQQLVEVRLLHLAQVLLQDHVKHLQMQARCAPGVREAYPRRIPGAGAAQAHRIHDERDVVGVGGACGMAIHLPAERVLVLKNSTAALKTQGVHPATQQIQQTQHLI